MMQAVRHSQPSNLDARVDELAVALKATTLEVNARMDENSEKLDHVLEALSKLTMACGGTNKPADLGKIPATQEGAEEEEDGLDRVYCSKCYKLSYACKCIRPSLETIFCQDSDCGFEEPHVRLFLEDMEKILKDSEIPEPREANRQCPLCNVNMMLRINEITTEARVCEQCLGVGQQDDIQQCDEKDCAITTGYFFHTACMVDHHDDLYLCEPCEAAGKQPYVDMDEDLEDQEGPWSDDSETDYQSVNSYRGLSVGMPLRGGTVSEIFPGLDKFTVSSTSGGINTV
jgi:hypothetical protein